MVSQAWTPYEPRAEAPWNLRRVVHLLRRAGFAATWNELRPDLREGPERSITRLLKGQSRGEGVPPDFPSTADTLVASAAGDLGRLKAWWVYRMLFGPDPLGERLTLMWHNHFATSAAKVGMTVRRQNEIFRTFARAPFGELLPRVVRDPALLLWLDAQANRKGQPNENLARELMELFTLGIGHYTETDVKEAARALTGWTVVKDRFQVDAYEHDTGEKTILGRKGAWKGDDLLRILLAHPATAERLAARLCDLFFGEGAVGANDVHVLASGLREHELDIGWAVETVLRSEAFFAEHNLGTRIVSPIEYVIGAARALELFDPSPNTLILAEFGTNLGQNLFHPPNVGGWPGGRSWLGTRAVIGRFNYAMALLDGDGVGLPRAVDALGLARRHGHGDNPEGIITFFAELVLGAVPGRAWRGRLLTAVAPKGAVGPATVRRIAALILSCAEAQLA